MRFFAALVLAIVNGFIALSYEILWFRVYSFVSEGSAGSFAFLLGFYLIGIAFGAFFSRRYCKKLEREEDRTSIRALALFVLAANVSGFLTIPVIAKLVHFISYGFTLPIVAVVTALLGSAFPLISHFGIASTDAVGPRLSYLYVGNIVGSALGSLVTGFLLMQYWGISTIAILIAVLGLSLEAILLLFSRLSFRVTLTGLAGTAIALFVLLKFGTGLFDGLYEKLLSKEDYTPRHKFAHVVENRSGVIGVAKNGALFGGGAYDGVYSLDIKNDRNGIVRPFALGALHPAPHEVLLIGLGSGSWAAVIANHPAVQHLTIVEINPGYIDLLRYYPDHSTLLINPKVEMITDDGRRWLRRHPERKFDAIVSNTTWNWRMDVSNLLSLEFLNLIRSHLNEHGIFFYNTTDSLRALCTGATAFPFALRFMNCLAVSDAPFNFDMPRWRMLLASYKLNGEPVFDLSKEADKTRLQQILQAASQEIETRESILQRTSGTLLITDDNMGTEWNREPQMSKPLKMAK